MKNILIPIILLLFLASPLFGQSSEEKTVAVRTSIFAQALTYNLDKQNAVGFYFGQLTTEIKKDNTEKAVNSFYGVNYAYAFNCINCDSIIIVTLLGPYGAVYTTADGSTYTYSGWALNVVGGYGWYFENDISVILGIGPSFATWSKESENLKSDKGYGKDVDDRVKMLSFQPISPFLAIGYSF